MPRGQPPSQDRCGRARWAMSRSMGIRSPTIAGAPGGGWAQQLRRASLRAARLLDGAPRLEQ